MSRQLQKYLRTRAVSTPWQLNGNERNDFSAAVVIPALAEVQSLPLTLASLATNPAQCLQQTLVLVVVNNGPDASREQKRENQQTLDWLRSAPAPALNIAWVDACSPGLELSAGEGIGLARKIGFDLALSRLDRTVSPLLISLDADTLVDAHYLGAISRHFQTSSCAGAVLPFRHQPGETPAQEAAVRRYELYLRSYLFGLQRAGSPYAYHTIGSAFACSAEGYVAAGGMNRRRAAEDFYFLQQLTKISGVEMLRGTLVRPSPRYSTRVPFGTGQAVQGQVEEQLSTFRFCPAAAFAALQGWLRIAERNWDQPAELVQKQIAKLPPEVADYLEQLNFARQWTKLQANHAAKEQFIRAFHGWFDGLRTRQLLGCWAQQRLVAEELKLVGELLAWGGTAVADDLPGQLAALEKLQL